MEKGFPKNVRQIGNVCDEPKIYMEDYVNTYLNQLKEKAAEEAVGALLVGEITEHLGVAVVFISGAIQMETLEINGTEVLVKDDTWKNLEEKKKEYFPEKEIVGWCLVENGHAMGLNRGVVRLHERLFAKTNTVFVWKDALESDEMIYAYKYKELMQMGGHYIYYERNPSMQNYMINTRKMNGVTPSEMVEDRAAKNFRSAVKGKMEYKEQKQNSHFLYAMSILLVVIVLAIGISTMNNFDKMESVQESIDALSQAVEHTGEGEVVAKEAENVEEYEGTMPDVSTIQEQLAERDYYLVQDGDTLDKISLKMYGDIRHVDEICEVNGLEDGNLIFIGQKLLLP